MRAILLALLLTAPGLAQEPLSDDPFDDTPISPPATVVEALERRDALLTDAKAKLDAAQAEYEASVADADRELIEGLKGLAKQSVAEGDLPEASKRWEEVLKVDAADEDAKKFFETIKRGDVVRKYAAKPTKQKEVAVTKVAVTKADVAGKSVKLHWNPTYWRLQENGAIYNMGAKKVIDNNATWTIENGQLRTWNSKGKLAMTFHYVEVKNRRFLVSEFTDDFIIIP